MATQIRRLLVVSSWQATLGLALLVLGFLIAAQIRSQGPRTQYTSQERQPLVQTALELQTQQDALKSNILSLRDQIQKAEAGTAGTDVIVRGLNAELQQARLIAGLVPLTGPGLVLQLDDANAPITPSGSQADYLVTARDVRTVVEELWLAGAEAIAVNSERVTGATAILDIGGSVLVNSAYLAPPYQISAIGPADLYDRLSASVGFVDFIKARAQQYGIGVSFAELKDVSVPAYAGTVRLRYARPVTPGTTPGP